MKSCSHCGKCCELELCEAGKIALNTEMDIHPCPLLYDSGNGKYCQLVMLESLSPLPKLISEALGRGKGCSLHPITPT